MIDKATTPEDLAVMFVERANARDAKAMSELYAEDAVIAFPPGSQSVGRDAIRELLEQLVEHGGEFQVEEPMPTIYYGDLALTSTRPADNTGGRVQVARRQPDGTWLRIIDRPEIRRPE